MSFYEFAEELKKENPNKIVFIKTGAFFNCIGKDSIIAEKILGLKRTCFAKGICKCGMPVQYWREHIENVKKVAQEKNIGIIIYDEMNNGRYKYNDKEYDVLLSVEGNYEQPSQINCKDCVKNIYYKEEKDTNYYNIKREEFEDLSNSIKKILEDIEKIFEILKDKK